MSRTDAHRARVVGDSGQPWMVLAHGIGGRPRDWDPVVAAFADQYRIVTFAQAGSTDADPHLFSPARHSSPIGFADDLGMLCGELGIRDAVFVGHSMAANAGVIAAAGDPGLFSNLILLNGSPCYVDDPAAGYRGGFTAADVEALLTGMRRDYDSWAAGFAPEAMANYERPELTLGFVEVLRNLDPQVAMTTFRAALTGDFRDVYPRVQAPTLVLQSRRDAVVPVAVGHWIAAAIPSSTFVELKSLGHFPHIADPAEVIAAIRAFRATSAGTARATSAGTARDQPA